MGFNRKMLRITATINGLLAPCLRDHVAALLVFQDLLVVPRIRFGFSAFPSREVDRLSNLREGPFLFVVAVLESSPLSVSGLGAWRQWFRVPTVPNRLGAGENVVQLGHEIVAYFAHAAFNPFSRFRRRTACMRRQTPQR